MFCCTSTWVFGTNGSFVAQFNEDRISTPTKHVPPGHDSPLVKGFNLIPVSQQNNIVSAVTLD